MKAIALDAHVIDALMRDLVGHDRTPAAFIVYLWLWRRTVGADRTVIGISLQEISHATGLSKAAVKRLKLRRLISASRPGPTLAPSYRVHMPWRD